MPSTTQRLLPGASFLHVCMCIALTASLAACGLAPLGQPQTGAGPAASNDYSLPANWLCRPGRNDACADGLIAATVRTAGDSSRETWKPDPKAPIDCFYVYPTVSMDAAPNSDMLPGLEERRAVQQQFAAFGSECRLFAPVYRQITVPAVRSHFIGTPMQSDPQIAYRDVLDAWNHYLRFDNKGRGVVLIGHSQGARLLSELIAREIEGKPVEKKIVSALLPGSNITVPKGKDVGGTFRRMPLCRSAAQTGCVVAYVSFRAASPPPAKTLFGRVARASDLVNDATVAAGANNAELEVACTNPAVLAGGGSALHAYLPVRAGLMDDASGKGPWSAQVQDIDADLVGVPGLLSAHCARSGDLSYLAVAVHPVANSPGADITGDMVYGGRVLREWGLHLVDINLALGDLRSLVRQQGQAYAAAQK